MMREINERIAAPDAAENQKTGKLFYWLAAAQTVQILIGAVLSFLVAPASLFVAHGETEAFMWIAAAFAGILMIALGIIVIALSLFAAGAFRRETSRRKVIGIAAAGAGVLAFPFGTVTGSILLRRIFKPEK